jgi:hypothetical protein
MTGYDSSIKKIYRPEFGSIQGHKMSSKQLMTGIENQNKKW